MSLLRRAGFGLFISAILHLVAIVIGGADAITMIVLAGLYAVIGLGLMLELRLLACVGFVILLVGLNFVLPSALGLGSITQWVAILMVLVGLGVSLLLFLHIWRGRRADQTAT